MGPPAPGPYHHTEELDPTQPGVGGDRDEGGVGERLGSQVRGTGLGVSAGEGLTFEREDVTNRRDHHKDAYRCITRRLQRRTKTTRTTVLKTEPIGDGFRLPR